MSKETFFISKELFGRVSEETLSKSNVDYPFIVINKTYYRVLEISWNFDYVRISFEINKDFNITKQIFIEDSDMFGVKLAQCETCFNEITYNHEHKKNICKIHIDNDKFWRK